MCAWYGIGVDYGDDCDSSLLHHFYYRHSCYVSADLPPTPWDCTVRHASLASRHWDRRRPYKGHLFGCSCRWRCHGSKGSHVAELVVVAAVVAAAGPVAEQNCPVRRNSNRSQTDRS